MRVTVFGADNDIGRKVVEELIWRGYEPRVFASDPSTVPETWGRRVQVLSGQLTDPVAVAAAVARAEAVVNALDPRLDRPGAHLVEGTVHMVGAMQDHGVHRYIGLGSPAVGLCPRERPTAQVRAHRAFLRSLHPRVHGQMRQMMATVTGAGLDWTIVRFLRSTPGRGPGLKYVGYFGQDAIGCSAAAGDVAAFAVTQLLDARHITNAPAVSN
ncbi:NAD(P)H-binding protein [Kocuria sp. CPCC 205292]|uniref:NAD(P)H-binding protein n=1 Tax=Kocuria cellulosilytica TaxID=3071451 RepID=UPI0034D65541